MKRCFHTYDIFDVKDDIREKYFDFCHNKALACGLTCKCSIVDDIPRLEMWGTKSSFLRYYLVTLTKCEYKIGGIKRLLSFIFE